MSRLYTIGSGVESPTNTFNIVASTEMTLSTGLSEAEIVVTGPSTATLLLTFAFADTATDFPNDTEWIKFCDDYEIQTSTLPASVGVEINETLVFSTSDALDAFVRELRTDFSMELKLK